MLVAAKGVSSLLTMCVILPAMVFARTAAMAFNSIADWEMDKLNPRTAGRHKLVSKATAYGLVGFSSLAFFGVCSLINPVCFLLSPVALAVIFFYSFTKRFTSYTQFFLGLSLAIAPVGAWLAVRGEFAWPPVILALGVIFWVGGFDLIYATQDYDFDRQQGLHSLVIRLGLAATLRVAQGLHLLMLIALIGFW